MEAISTHRMGENNRIIASYGGREHQSLSQGYLKCGARLASEVSNGDIVPFVESNEHLWWGERWGKGLEGQITKKGGENQGAN